MLKRRIFAASLASVLALSSFSAAAFADDEIKSQTVTKAELQKYVDSFEKFREEDIFEYGTIQGEYFQDAIDAAETVLEDDKATDDDYTAAYQMLKAVYEKMKPYTKDELAGKIEDYKGIYEGNNVLNEVLGDTIYTEDSWSDFESAYDEALNYVDSGDGRLISDAYIQLVEAADNLEALDKVTKAQFRAALKDYEKIISKANDYEGWRRGTCSVAPTTGSLDSKELKKVKDAAYITFEQLMDMVTGASTKKIADSKGKAEAVGDGKSTWVNVVGSGADVADGIKKEYDRFDEIKSSTETTDVDIVAAYNAAKDAVAVFNGWTEDNTKRAAKADVEKLIKEYHNDFVAAAMITKAQELVHEIDTDAVYDEENKVMKATKAGAIKVDEDGFICIKDGKYDADSTTGKDKKITKGTDLLQFIPVTEGDLAEFTKNVTAAKANENTVENKKKECDEAFDKDTINAFLAVYKELCTLGTKCAGGTDLSDVDNPISAGCRACDDFKKLWKAYEKFLDAWYKIVDEKEFNELSGVKSFNVTSVDNKVFLKYTAQDVYDLERRYAEFEAAVTKYKGSECSHKSDFDSDGKVDEAAAKIEADGAGGTTETLAKTEMLVELKTTLESRGIEDTGALEAAAELAETYLNEEDINKSEGSNVLLDAIGDIDEHDTVSKATGSVTEWTLVKRYLQYALEDLFPETAAKKTYTKKDVSDLITKAYDLAEKTGEASKFNEKHMKLVDARQAALEWLAAANKTKTYKEGDKVEYDAKKGGTTGITSGNDATATYKALNTAYEALDTELKNYAISYGEIAAKIVEISKYLDENDSEALETALKDVAYKLSTLDAGGEDDDENEVFDEYRSFQKFNRLCTGGDDQTEEEKALKAAYDALTSAYNDLTSPTTTKGDVNGSDYE